MGTLRIATPAEARRYGVFRRLVGSRWYKSSHSACVYERPKPYRLQDTFNAIRAQQLRALAAPGAYPLHGDGVQTASVRSQHFATNEALRIALVEARYQDWLATRQTGG